jgi:adenine/guanine phosphoribosyltransferase-like PRPP-binding protein
VSGWNGTWVADRLGIELEDAPGRAPLALADLVGLALRVNPKRPHLLVSTVLAKHVPTDPRLVRAAGHLLGLRVAEHLGRLEADGSADVAARLRSALAVGAGEPAADLDGLATATDAALAAVEPGDGVVLGYAETATALGHLVGRAVGLPSVYSTRRVVPGVPRVLGFEESHSHATTHLVLAEDPALLATPGPAVLVDDELSTGRTALATIRALHAHAPRAEYVVAALVDARRAADREHIARVADELGARISVVALAEGEVRVPEAAVAPEPEPQPQSQPEHDAVVDARPSGALVPGADPGDAWPVGVRTSGRHGFVPSDEAPLADAAAAVAARVGERLDAAGVDAAGDVLVLGTEELMYAPLAVAEALRRAGRATYFSTTTRSPVQVRDVPGCALPRARPRRGRVRRGRPLRLQRGRPGLGGDRRRARPPDGDRRARRPRRDACRPGTPRAARAPGGAARRPARCPSAARPGVRLLRRRRGGLAAAGPLPRAPRGRP